MSSSETIQKISRSLTLSVIEGIVYCFMLGVGETFFSAFVLALGLGEVKAGLIATLPMLVGSCLQMISPQAVRKLGSYKNWVVSCAVVQAFAFLPLIALAHAKTASFTLTFLAIVLYWTGALGTAAAWNAWMGTLVPTQIRPRYFAKRNHMLYYGVLAGLITGSLIAQAGKSNGWEMQAFMIMFGLGFLGRLVSSICLSRQYEPPNATESQERHSLKSAFEKLLMHKNTRVLQYILLIQIFANISGPFFSPYMLSELSLDYRHYMVLVCASFLSRAFALPFISRKMKDITALTLLKWGGLLIIPWPILWIISDNFYYLLATQIVGGAAWAIFELGMTLSYFEGIEPKDRMSLLSVFGFINALCMSMGTLLGGQLLYRFGVDREGYYVIFLISAVLRVGALFFLRGAKDLRIKVRLVALKVNALRPAVGALARPLWHALDHDDGEHPDNESRK